MPDTTSGCKCEELEKKTLTLTHNLNDHSTTMTFTNESSSFSYTVQNDSTIIKEALEETMLNI